MEDHRERHIEAVGLLELLAAPVVKRRRSGEAKGRIVVEALARGVTVNEMARRHGQQANHLSTLRTLAWQRKLVVSEVNGAEFAAPVTLGSQPRPQP